MVSVRVSLLALLAFCQSTAAQTSGVNRASVDWTAQPVAVGCLLTHTVPQFGKVSFTHASDGGDLLSIDHSDKVLLSSGDITIETLPPAWRVDQPPTTLAQLKVDASEESIKLEAELTSQVVSHLAGGTRILVNLLPADDDDHGSSSSIGAKLLRVILEPRGFALAYKRYRECNGDTIPQSLLPLVANGPLKREGVSGVRETDAMRVAKYLKHESSAPGDVGPSKSHQSSVAKTYSADIHHADWVAVSTPFDCSLTHTIPQFGKATFSRTAGQPAAFYIESKEKLAFPEGVTAIETLPPVWRHDVLPKGLGQATAVEGNHPITLKADDLTKLVATLTNGTSLMFTSVPDESTSSSIGVTRLVLGSKNFVTGYKTYQQCIKELIDYTMNDVLRTMIHYGEKPEGLTAANKSDLLKVARYVKADTKVIAVLVDGHSDNEGSAEENEALTKQEAEWVAAYLIEQGVPSDKVTTRWHGGKFPIADNKNPAGRAQNRRVTIRLEDATLRAEALKRAEERKAENEKIAAERAANEAKRAEEKAARDLAKGKRSGGDNASSGENSSRDKVAEPGKITPDELKDMIEGLDLIDGK